MKNAIHDWNSLLSKLIVPICSRIVPQRKLLDVSETILGIIFQRANGRSPSELNHNWLCKTIVGEAQKSFRRRKSEPIPFADIGGNYDPAEIVETTADHFPQEYFASLREYLANLPMAHRVALRTRFAVEGDKLTVKQAARQLEKSESRVRQLCAEAINVLKRKFAANRNQSNN